jgi:hypothetical protein
LLLRQAIERALPTAEALYPGYSLLFLFASHSAYADDALRASKMNKRDGGQQPFLRNGWFRSDDGTTHVQEMYNIQEDPVTRQQVRIQKGVERVLRERGLNLECPKPKCQTCQAVADCKVCVKGTQCDYCTSTRLCDACVERKQRCRCVPKRTVQRQTKRQMQQSPPKCTSDGKSIACFLAYIL